MCATSEINEGVSPFVPLAGEDEGRGRPAPSFLGIQLVGRNQAGKFYAIGQVCASRAGRVEAVLIDHKPLIDRHLWVESCQKMRVKRGNQDIGTTRPSSRDYRLIN